MKIVLYVIQGLLFVASSFSAAAPKIKPPKGEILHLVSQKGTIDLVNKKKVVKSFAQLDGARVELARVSVFKNLVRGFAGDRAFVIYKDGDEFTFLVPNKLQNGNGELSVHQKYTGQKYHIKVNREVRNFKSVVSEKTISCTWTTSYTVFDMTTDSDGNSTLTPREITDYHTGTQRAIVDDRNWEDRLNVNIYDDSASLNGKTDFIARVAQITVKELTSCR